MLFHTFEFLIFFAVVYFIYTQILKNSLPFQNLLILIASYIFYGWWDWRFLILIMASTIIDFFCGLYIDKSEYRIQKKCWFILSVFTNIGILLIFKYFNFFVGSLTEAFSLIGWNINPWTLNIILPVGISFYTFQSMSYTIDIYRNKLQPCKDPIAFAAFVSFFPQLVAGPIERAKNLLPQFLTRRDITSSGIKEGTQLIILGLFKKVVIADTLAPVVNQIFNNYQQLSSLSLFLGALYFSIQIYADFSGYSNIARGIARLMGFRLMVNFEFPYFSRNLGEFWRRWHISLSTWFRDYLYIPLGGSQLGLSFTIRNVFIVFLVSGLWHGANWTFVAWGLYHALLFVPLLIIGRNRTYLNSVFESKSTWSPLASILTTFIIVTIGWIFFRAEDISHALSYLDNMMSFDGRLRNEYNYYMLVLMALFTADILLARMRDSMAFYFILLGAVIAGFLNTSPSEFIYFQF